MCAATFSPPLSLAPQVQASEEEQLDELEAQLQGDSIPGCTLIGTYTETDAAADTFPTTSQLQPAAPHSASPAGRAEGHEGGEAETVVEVAVARREGGSSAVNGLSSDGGPGEGEEEGEEEEPSLPLRVLQPFPAWPAAAVEGLRYRAEDCTAKITKRAVREARAKELRMEILNSER